MSGQTGSLQAQLFIHVFILLGGLLGLTLGMIHGLRSTAFRWTALLGWAFATHALSDLYLWLYWTKTSIDLRVLILLPLNVVLIPVYFLFQYIRSFTSAGQLGRSYGRFLAAVACLEIGLYLLPAGAALFTGAITQSVLSFAKSVRNTLTVGSLPLVVGACLLLYRLIRRYQRSAGETALQRELVAWLYQLFIGLCLVYGLALVPLIVKLTSGWQSRALFYPLGIGSSIFLVWNGIQAFVVHERLRTDATSDVIDNAEVLSAAANLYREVIRLIEQERFFKQADLKLGDVASRLAVSPHYLSRIINQQANKNFNDLINEFRVDEVKRLMDDPAFNKYTLEGLGREAGFGAKSTYQASFKRLTGLTPSQYRASQRPVS